VDVDEESFLAAYDPTRFERPSLAVDVVLLTVADGVVRALLVPRERHPFAGTWTLPGGFVGFDEALSAAARRVLDRKAALRGVFLEQLYTFGDPARDPRTRIISVAYMALVDADRASATPGRWCDLVVPWEGTTGGAVDAVVEGRVVAVGFDHADILGMAVARLRSRLDTSPIGFQLLPETFTLRALQDVHEAVSGVRTNKDSFRRRMLASGQLEATGEREGAVGHRPAELYRFIRRSAV
jgi:8-oxo-dGTP diphosphatase